MAYSKIKKIIFILLCCIVLIFPFWCVRGLCAEVENVDISTATGIAISSSYNYFSEASSSSYVNYFPVEVGYKYYITNNTTLTRRIVECSEQPALNVVYNYLVTLEGGETYNYIPTNNSYIYVSTAGGNFMVTREKIPGMNSAIGDLVDNVGINSVWNIFDISINYIVVVVLFAFGVFIIFRIIKKISKGKEGL